MKKELTREEEKQILINKETRLVLLKKRNMLRNLPKQIIKNVEEDKKRKLI